jgi:hypothetical protein
MSETINASHTMNGTAFGVGKSLEIPQLAAPPVAPATAVPVTETMQQIDARIRRTFRVLDKVATGVVHGNIRAMIVSGAAGCGKTHNLKAVLEQGKSDGFCTFTEVGGTSSAIGLYQLLWDARDAGNVLMLDDCDTIFADLEAVNILKRALDTGKRRRVSWNKESRVLAERGIDNSFDFEGGVVFVTNTDFTSEIAKQNKMAPHYSALLSRSLYMDLGIHSKREVLVRIGQVIFSQEFLRSNELTPSMGKDMMAWLTRHLNRVRVLSIRTAIQLANFMHTDPTEWEELAESTMLKTR